jgi:hypothetical protein
LIENSVYLPNINIKKKKGMAEELPPSPSSVITFFIESPLKNNPVFFQDNQKLDTHGHCPWYIPRCFVTVSCSCVFVGRVVLFIYFLLLCLSSLPMHSIGDYFLFCFVKVCVSHDFFSIGKQSLTTIH